MEMSVRPWAIFTMEMPLSVQDESVIELNILGKTCLNNGLQSAHRLKITAI